MFKRKKNSQLDTFYIFLNESVYPDQPTQKCHAIFPRKKSTLVWRRIPYYTQQKIKVMRGRVVKTYSTVQATGNKKPTAQNKQRDFEKRSKW